MPKFKKVQIWVQGRDLGCDICGATAIKALATTYGKLISPRCAQHTKGLGETYGMDFEAREGHVVAGDLRRVADAAYIPEGHVVQITNGTSTASRDDAAWFMAHPNRTHRVREAFVDELPGPVTKMIARVVVRQVAPGRRVRRWVVGDAPIPDQDAVLGVVFDTPTGGHVLIREATAFAKLMGLTGGTA